MKKVIVQQLGKTDDKTRILFTFSDMESYHNFMQSIDHLSLEFK